ncbi:menaquinone biosynthetic enzyme MqnA/MqnD family protein [Gorillibacterium massiliense]|uniref:menaquinone biosynthetic enzyme MqnA/MqnD family protein n=1 Tax=Gorillibacterium massiliense TaxID=1280390 RepID=UPI0004B0E696|nr:menaquinone biosynthesis protein [Gorillibacterium massiliense]
MNKPLIRIGRIDFTNVWPIYYYFPVDRFGEKVELIKQVPTGLNKAIAAGAVDMGAISSFAYGENSEQLVLFPDLSVSAWGKVNSILLFHKKPLSEVAHGKIMLPTTSASSVNLLKILLSKFFDGNPQYRYDAPSLSNMREDEDAALLIGDDAIRSDWEESGYTVTDLGELWNEKTGRWMSFAVWAVRRDTVERYPELVSEVYHAFRDSKARGLADPTPLVVEAMATIGGTEEYWRRYFGQLTYDFGPEQWSGLQLYYDYAFELGLLDRPVTIDLWQDIPSYR